MTVNYLPLAIGAAVGLYVVTRFKNSGLEKKSWAYPALLATFPVYYWVFAVSASDFGALEKEVAVGLLFMALAFVTYKLENAIGLLLLGMGYVGHAVYDVLHDQAFVNRGTPLWWPEFCGVVDVLIGLYILYRASSLKGGPTANV